MKFGRIISVDFEKTFGNLELDVWRTINFGFYEMFGRYFKDYLRDRYRSWICPRIFWDLLCIDFFKEDFQMWIFKRFLANI